MIYQYKRVESDIASSIASARREALMALGTFLDPSVRSASSKSEEAVFSEAKLDFINTDECGIQYRELKS